MPKQEVQQGVQIAFWAQYASTFNGCSCFVSFEMLKTCACQGLVGARDAAECSQHPDVHGAWLLTWLVLTQQINGQNGLHQLCEAAHGNWGSPQ